MQQLAGMGFGMVQEAAESPRKRLKWLSGACG